MLIREQLGEIEYHLKSGLKGSQNVAVEIVTPEAVGGNPTLAAFFTMDGSVARSTGSHKPLAISAEDLADLSELQNSMSEALPSYMVPAMYIPINFIPVTTATKIDRAELRHMALKFSEEEFNMYSLSSQTKRKPSTEVELSLAALWSTVLDINLNRIGADDSFFRLGGDSLMAMRLATLAFDRGVSLTIANIFGNPTLSAMASVSETVLDQSSSTPDSEPYQLLGDSWHLPDLLQQAATQCSIVTEAIQDIYPCTSLQEGIMALSQRQQNSYLYQRVFRLPPTVNIDLLQEAWQLVTDRSPILRTRIVYMDNSQSLQVVVETELDWRSAESLEFYLESDKQEPFVYGGNLTRFGLVNDSKDQYFIFTANHSVYDGISLPLIFNQVQETYNFATPDDAPPFSRFIEYLENSDKNAANNFWQEQLSGGKPLTFPQYPSPKHELHVDQATFHAVNIQRKSGSDVTMASLLRAAWAIVLGQYSESSDVVFGASTYLSFTRFCA
jgi:aryl carrier-like protein